MLIRMREPLREAAGEGTEGGGGDGGGDQPKPMTEEDVGRVVNAAVTAQLKRALPNVVKEALGSLNLTEQIEQTVKKIVPQPPAGGDGGGDSGDGKPRLTTKDLEKQIQALSEKLENSEKARSTAEQERAEIEQRSKFMSAKASFRNAVASKVRPELLDVLVDYAAETQKRLTVDENGNALFRVKRAPYKGAPEQDEDIPLDEAVPLFLSSKEVHPFLPAPGGQQGGSGQPNQQRGRVPVIRASGDSDEAQAAAALDALQSAGVDPGSLL